MLGDELLVMVHPEDNEIDTRTLIGKFACRNHRATSVHRFEAVVCETAIVVNSKICRMQYVEYVNFGTMV